MSGQGVIRIGVAGAMGRMGRVVAGLAAEQPELDLTALFDRPDVAGQSVDGRVLTDAKTALGRCDVIIDFSTGAASAELARQAGGHGGVALVVGSTGMSQDEERIVREASGRIAIVKSGNFSLGVNLLLGLVRQAARALPADFDIEVFEAHHRRKIDAPSGTGLMLGRAAAEGRGVELDSVSERARDGVTGPLAPSAFRSCAPAASWASTAWSSPPRTRSSPCRIRRAIARCSPGAPWSPPAGPSAVRPASTT